MSLNRCGNNDSVAASKKVPVNFFGLIVCFNYRVITLIVELFEFKLAWGASASESVVCVFLVAFR